MLRADSPVQKLVITGFEPERASLKDQAADFLRDAIVSGRIPPGTKIVERDVATILGISRAPARDALMHLESEGLIISGPSARHVIEPSERDIRDLYRVRLALESLAVELAIENISDEHRREQLAALESMEEAVRQEDRDAFVKADLDGHLLVWKQADNRHLEENLRRMTGPIFMFMANTSEHYGWWETLELHREMVTYINRADAVAAVASIERHMLSASEQAVSVFQRRREQILSRLDDAPDRKSELQGGEASGWSPARGRV